MPPAAISLLAWCGGFGLAAQLGGAAGAVLGGLALLLVPAAWLRHEWKLQPVLEKRIQT